MSLAFNAAKLPQRVAGNGQRAIIIVLCECYQIVTHKLDLTWSDRRSDHVMDVAPHRHIEHIDIAAYGVFIGDADYQDGDEGYVVVIQIFLLRLKQSPQRKREAEVFAEQLCVNSFTLFLCGELKVAIRTPFVEAKTAAAKYVTAFNTLQTHNKSI
ncbi:hypothetical protein [Ferruginibacter sp.]